VSIFSGSPCSTARLRSANFSALNAAILALSSVSTNSQH
jgi:hypothetical protein